MRHLSRTLLLASLLLAAPVSFASTQSYISHALIFVLQGVDLNAAGTDNPIFIGNGLNNVKYIARRVTVTNASTSLAASAVTLGLFTGPGGTGTAVIPLSTLTALNSTTKFVEVPLTFTNYATVPTVYVRCGTAHGSAATVDVYLEVTPLL